MRQVPALILPVLMAAPLSGQVFERMFNPDVNVTLHHPPGLGLKIKRAAFLLPKNPFGRELVTLLMEDLTRQSPIELVDRSHLDQILEEQELGTQGYLEPATVARLGKLLGPSVLLIVDVTRCKGTVTPLQNKRDIVKDKKVVGVEVTFLTKTRLDFVATFQAVDLETGRIFGVQRFALEPEAVAESKEGQPEAPPEGPLREIAYEQVKHSVHRLLLPWSENRKLIFYNDKAYGMKTAYQYLEGGDAEGALRRSLEALDQAMQDPKSQRKHKGRTHYNVGMCYFILARHGEAVPYLKSAREIDLENTIYRDALSECLKAIELQDQLQMVEARSQASIPVPPNENEKTNTQTQPSNVNTTQDQKGLKSIEERLIKLDTLKQKGLITESEYRKRREEILKEI